MHDPDTNDMRGLRVLIAEDTPAVANALHSLLEDIGMAVVGPVSTSDAAERLLVDEPVDLALIDMHLSGGTGYALVERLRQGNVRVVAISGSAELPAKSRSVATLAKPFSGRALLETLCKLMRVA